jgi:chorismate mutase
MLPESMQKTVEAKKLLESGAVKSVQEAVDRVGLSRSAFYKYKEAVFPFHTVMNQQIITISVNLEHRTGVLSQMLTYIARNGGNILTINQTIPLQGLAHVVLSIETANMAMNMTQLTEELKQLDGVKRVALIGQQV